MPLVSSRLAIGQALVALIGTITDPATSLPIVQITKLGAIFDPSTFISWCSVMHSQGQGKPAGSGGTQIGWRIEDDVIMQIEVGVGPYETDSTAAQESMLNIQDVLLPSLHTHFLLPGASNPAQALPSVFNFQLENTPDRSTVARFPNGHAYLLWRVLVTAKQQYNVLLQEP